MEFSFEAIGTTWNITILDKLDGDILLNIKKDINDRIDIFDKDYSRFRSDSLVHKMSQVAGEYILPDDAKPMMDLYHKLYDITSGLMTPFIGQVLIDTGYDAQYSLVPKDKIEKAIKWEDAIEYSFPKINIKVPTMLDFGAIGKGYLIDIVSKILDSYNLHCYTVEAGGDMIYKNNKGEKLSVGLENPNDTKQIVGKAEILNQSLCGSAGNRRAWNKYHHIINPLTVESPRHIAGLWVLASDTMLADAISTALFFCPAMILQNHFKFEYAILFTDGNWEVSKDFPGGFFTE